ncbi:acyl-coenzyme A synthetase/AMP-(fatty) acid ligase [Skermanella aerolata]|uniref:AMP-binding protein n=1 Tax=Skermanella aerolata TaxID=393310 RepID=UPI003D20ED1C
MSTLPLMRYADAGAAMAWRNGERIDVCRFLATSAALAEALPDCDHIVNLCTDRFDFAAGLAAALMRKQVSLLPPNDRPVMLRQLAQAYPGAVCLTDAGVAYEGMTCVQVPEPPSGGGMREIPSFPEDQVAAIAFTSGSTGQPMPQVKTWGTLVRSVHGEGAALGMAELAGAFLVGTVPHQHMYGLESVILLALQHGMALQAKRPFYPGDIAAALDELPGRRMLVTTPVHLKTLLADGVKLPAVDFLLCATAPLAPQLASEAEWMFDAPLYEIYGCSETGQVAVRRPKLSAEWRCIEGIRLRQDDEGTWASGDFLKGETLLADVIELNAPDRFILHGRSADQVNIAGKRSSLAYLNHHLNSIEGVRDGVFVMPESAREDGGTVRLTAFVVGQDLTAETLLARLRERIEPAFLPRPLHFVDALPRNATGKLTAEAIQRLLGK